MSETRFTHDKKGRAYVRLTFKDARRRGKPRTVWALRVSGSVYVRANANGSEWEDPKAPANVSRTETILVYEEDVIFEASAVLDLHYNELEVVDPAPATGADPVA